MRKISALKLLDEAILPVVLVVFCKIVAIFILTLVFNIPWSFNSTSGSYSFYFINFKDASGVFFVSSISDLVMILFVAVGFLWTLFRGSYFREDKLHPITAARLHKKGKESLIVDKNKAYHQAAVWLSLSWFTFFLSLDNVLQGSTSLLTFGVAVVATLGLTVVLLENSRS